VCNCKGVRRFVSTFSSLSIQKSIRVGVLILFGFSFTRSASQIPRQFSVVLPHPSHVVHHTFLGSFQLCCPTCLGRVVFLRLLAFRLSWFLDGVFFVMCSCWIDGCFILVKSGMCFSITMVVCCLSSFLELKLYSTTPRSGVKQAGAAT
jgi:hypothetical protein